MAKRNYINNPDMHKAMTDYILSCREEDKRAEAEGREPVYPQIPDYIVECFMKIANRFGTKPNFAGYKFLDDMKGDAIENCIRYIRNYDPYKKNAEGQYIENPFAYFTQYVKNSFLQRIEKEKKELYFKYKNYQNLQLQDSINGEITSNTELNEISNAFISDFEERVLTSKKKRVKMNPNNVNKFFE